MAASNSGFDVFFWRISARTPELWELLDNATLALSPEVTDARVEDGSEPHDRGDKECEAGCPAHASARRRRKQYGDHQSDRGDTQECDNGSPNRSWLLRLGLSCPRGYRPSVPHALSDRVLFVGRPHRERNDLGWFVSHHRLHGRSATSRPIVADSPRHWRAANGKRRGRDASPVARRALGPVHRLSSQLGRSGGRGGPNRWFLRERGAHPQVLAAATTDRCQIHAREHPTAK